MNKQPLINFIQNNIQNIKVNDEAVLTSSEMFEEKEFLEIEYLILVQK